MKITTNQFGIIEFEESSVIKFEKGLFGFENLTKFLLLQTEGSIYNWLNSIEEPEITFPLVSLIMIDEKFPSEDNNDVFGMVTLNPDPLQVTLNMKAPVYINHSDKTGYQVILDDEKFMINYNLFVEG